MDREKRLELLVGGRVLNNPRGSYLLIQRDLSAIEQTPVVEYVMSKVPHLKLGQAAKEFPTMHLQRKVKEKMLFWDIETCGSTTSAPIISIAGLSLILQDGKPPSANVFDLFARNPDEERGLIQAFLDLVPKYDHFFTYNGQTFDFNRLTWRALANRIPLDGHYHPHLKEVMPTPEKHTDLYHIVRQRLGKDKIIDGRAKTAEVVVFNYRRTDDIGGAQIGNAYREYLGMESDTTTKDKREIGLNAARIIEHNLMDVVACGAIFTKLCIDGNLSQPKQ